MTGLYRKISITFRLVGNSVKPYTSCNNTHSNIPPIYIYTLSNPRLINCLHFFSTELSQQFLPYTIIGSFF